LAHRVCGAPDFQAGRLTSHTSPDPTTFCKAFYRRIWSAVNQLEWIKTIIKDRSPLRKVCPAFTDNTTNAGPDIGFANVLINQKKKEA
jgi:hypothetical protein